jgi:hypothetical protein
LTNAAVEWLRSANDTLNSLDDGSVPPGAFGVTTDLVVDDRRPGGIGTGVHDGRSWAAFLESGWAPGVPTPRNSVVDVLAVRGQRLAVALERFDYGAETYSDYLTCTQLDPSLMLLQRYVLFGADEQGAAVAELDRMHAEIDD